MEQTAPVCWSTLNVNPHIILPCFWERLSAKTSDLTTSEFGGYWRLLIHQWQKGYIPDPARLAKLAQIMGCSKKTAESIWAEIGYKFNEACPCGCGRLRKASMEEKREDQQRRSKTGTENGAKGGRPKKPTETKQGTKPETQIKPKDEPERKLPYPDPNPIPSVPITGSDLGGALPVTTSRARPHAPSSAGMSPLEWGKKHSDHEPGFCTWMCFPSDLFAQFAARLASVEGIHLDDARGQVRLWAEGIRASGILPTGKMYDFWNGQFERTHGSSAPAQDGAAGRHERNRQRLNDFAEHG